MVKGLFERRKVIRFVDMEGDIGELRYEKRSDGKVLVDEMFFTRLMGAVGFQRVDPESQWHESVN